MLVVKLVMVKLYLVRHNSYNRNHDTLMLEYGMSIVAVDYDYDDDDAVVADHGDIVDLQQMPLRLSVTPWVQLSDVCQS